MLSNALIDRLFILYKQKILAFGTPDRADISSRLERPEKLV